MFRVSFVQDHRSFVDEFKWLKIDPKLQGTRLKFGLNLSSIFFYRLYIARSQFFFRFVDC
jgi:hypothetical protein